MYLAASGNLDKTNSSACGSSEPVDVYDEEDDTSTDLLTFALDFEPWSQRQAPLPVYQDFVKHLERSWARPRKVTAPHSALSVQNGAAGHGLDGAMRASPTFALLAGAAPTSNRAACHPNKKCHTTDGLVVKACQLAAMATQLANTNGGLLVYLEGLIQDLEPKSPADLLPEMSSAIDMVIQGASAQAKRLHRMRPRRACPPLFRGVLEMKVRDKSHSAVLANKISVMLRKGAKTSRSAGIEMGVLFQRPPRPEADRHILPHSGFETPEQVRQDPWCWRLSILFCPFLQRLRGFTVCAQ
eukprot:superscaffoldBa00001313_g10021